eukprot:Hpha_TRINITY_DN12355_c0_g1::TRINITY_DN12355_c0_g1_i1::g.155893::m.155893
MSNSRRSSARSDATEPRPASAETGYGSLSPSQVGSPGSQSRMTSLPGSRMGSREAGRGPTGADVAHLLDLGERDAWDEVREQMVKQTQRMLEDSGRREVDPAAISHTDGPTRAPSRLLQNSRLALELGHVLDKISKISDAMGGAKVHSLDSGTLRDWSLRIDDGVREARSLGRDFAKKIAAAMGRESGQGDLDFEASPTGEDEGTKRQQSTRKRSPISTRARIRSQSVNAALQQSHDPGRIQSSLPLPAAEAVAASIYLCTEAAANLLQADRSCVWLPDSRRGDLAAAVLVGYPGVRACELRCAEHEGVVGGCYATKVAASSLSTASYQHTGVQAAGRGYRVWSTLVVPLLTPESETARGVIQFVNKNGGDTFSREDECLAWRCAQMLAFILGHYGAAADLGSHGYDPTTLHRTAGRPQRASGGLVQILGFDSREAQRKQLVLRDIEGFAYQDAKGERLVANSSNLVEVSGHLRRLEDGWRKAIELNRMYQEQMQAQGSNMRAVIAQLQDELNQTKSALETLRSVLGSSGMGGVSAFNADVAPQAAPSPVKEPRSPLMTPLPGFAAEAGDAVDTPSAGEEGGWLPRPGVSVRLQGEEELQKVFRKNQLTWLPQMAGYAHQRAVVFATDSETGTVQVMLVGGGVLRLPLSGIKADDGSLRESGEVSPSGDAGTCIAPAPPPVVGRCTGKAQRPGIMYGMRRGIPERRFVRTQRRTAQKAQAVPKQVQWASDSVNLPQPYAQALATAPIAPEYLTSADALLAGAIPGESPSMEPAGRPGVDTVPEAPTLSAAMDGTPSQHAPSQSQPAAESDVDSVPEDLPRAEVHHGRITPSRPDQLPPI